MIVVEVRVVGYGSLFSWLASGEKGEILTLDSGASVADLIRKTGIPDQEIWMITVNAKKASLDQVLQHGDEVRLFSPLGGGS
jgi:sulfur carrier protein ThiS